MANPGLFLFIFVCKRKFYTKTVGFSEIVGVEGEYTDHLITTTAQQL